MLFLGSYVFFSGCGIQSCPGCSAFQCAPSHSNCNCGLWTVRSKRGVLHWGCSLCLAWTDTNIQCLSFCNASLESPWSHAKFFPPHTPDRNCPPSISSVANSPSPYLIDFETHTGLLRFFSSFSFIESLTLYEGSNSFLWSQDICLLSQVDSVLTLISTFLLMFAGNENWYFFTFAFSSIRGRAGCAHILRQSLPLSQPSLLLPPQHGYLARYRWHRIIDKGAPSRPQPQQHIAEFLSYS